MLTAKELNTILFALRSMQANTQDIPGPTPDEYGELLGADEIDDLCQRLNEGDVQ